jgi:hypothetical protein
MSEESVNSYRRPIVDLEDYRSRNNKKAKDYYYKNHETVKTKMRERAANKRIQTQETIKDVTAAVADIQSALNKVTASLKRLTDTPSRVSASVELSL